ncbi:MAG: hypothetical protein FWD73_17680 [Polyangiaceae bacterium]|nr:hypothetical protein [Polyangiaceae bacterium]
MKQAGTSVALAGLVCALSWAGCKGSDADGAVGSTAATGVWCGVSPVGMTTRLLILGDGLIDGVYTAASGCTNVVLTGDSGGLRGAITSANDSNISGSLVDIGFADGDTETIKFSGSVSAKKSASLNVTIPGVGSGNMTLSYDSAFDGTLPLSSVAGTYTIKTGSLIPGGTTTQPYTLIIDADGTVTMLQTSGCSASGTVQSRSDVAALDLDITFTGNCIMSSGTHATGVIGRGFVGSSTDKHLDIEGHPAGSSFSTPGFLLTALLSGPPPTPKDAGTDSGGTTPPVGPLCYGDSAAGAIKGTCTTKYPGGMCTSQEINDLYAACIGGTSSYDKCIAAETSPSCDECLEGANRSTDIPAVFQIINETTISTSVSAEVCFFMQLRMPECALPFQNYDYCRSVACQSFLDDDDAYNNCWDQAKRGACLSSFSAVPIDCMNADNALKATDPAYTACTGTNPSSFESVFKATANVLCVTGAP